MVDDKRIGDNLNEWRYPVLTFGSDETQLQQQILRNEKLSGINISNDLWKEHCSTVNTVLNPLLTGLQKYAKKEFEGLIIHHYVRQGSSREGLKVSDALEFDCLLVFEINGMEFEKCPVFPYYGCEIPDLIKLRVIDYIRYPWLERLNILENNEFYKRTYYINTKNLHEKVFKALLDRTRAQVEEQLPVGDRNIYSMRRAVNPPTCAIRITVNKDISHVKEIYNKVSLESLNQAIGEVRRVNKPTLDIDLVPAILLRQDSVPDPYTVRNKYEKEMRCPVYVVMKWAHNQREMDQTVDCEKLWRESSCTYEKQIFDIARRNQSQQYLMTACRIVKSYVKWQKNNRPCSSQLHKVAVSYYLKNICLHCIALLTVPSQNNTLSGLKEALGYFLRFFELCIENRNLPHFFYCNPWVSTMFPNCSFGEGSTKKNLYCNVSWDTYGQAERAFREMLGDLKGLYTEYRFLDEDRIGPFKELLGNSHEYKKPDPVLSKSCSYYTFISIVVGILAVVLACMYFALNMQYK